MKGRYYKTSRKHLVDSRAVLSEKASLVRLLGSYHFVAEELPSFENLSRGRVILRRYEVPTVLPLRKKNKKTAHPLTSHWVGPNPLCHGRDSMLIPFLAAPPHDDSGIMRHVQTLCRARQHTRGGEQQGAHASTSRVKLAMLQNQNAACARHLTHDRAEGAARTTNLRHCGSTSDVLIGFGFLARTIKIQNMHRFLQPNLKHHHRKHHPTAAPANWGRTEERGKPKHRLQRSEKKKKIHLRQHNRKKKKKNAQEQLTSSSTLA